MPSSQPPAFKAPYTHALRSNGDVPRWAFERKGYRARLPEGMVEPWYSPEYADALVQSGFRGIQVRRALQSLPHSMASGLLRRRQSERQRALSPSYRKRLDRAAERLCDLFGWVDLRGLNVVSMNALLRAGERGAQNTLTVLRCVLEEHTAHKGIPALSEVKGQIGEDDLCRFLRFMPMYSPERVALMLMIHTGEDLGSVMQITPNDTRSYKALWQSPDLIKELPFPHDIKEPYVAASGGKSIDKSIISNRFRDAAAHAALPEPTRSALRHLHSERVSEAIAWVAA